MINSSGCMSHRSWRLGVCWVELNPKSKALNHLHVSHRQVEENITKLRSLQGTAFLYCTSYGGIGG